MSQQTFKKQCEICGNPTSRKDSKYCSRECVAEAQRRAVYWHHCTLCEVRYKSGSPIPGLCSAACRREAERKALALVRARKREERRLERLRQDRQEFIFGDEINLVNLPEDHELAEIAGDFLPAASLDSPQRPVDPFLGF